MVNITISFDYVIILLLHPFSSREKIRNIREKFRERNERDKKNQKEREREKKIFREREKKWKNEREMRF